MEENTKNTNQKNKVNRSQAGEKRLVATYLRYQTELGDPNPMNMNQKIHR